MTRWSIGDITVMPGFPIESRECTRCGELRPQQLVRRFARSGVKLSHVFRSVEHDRELKGGSGEDWYVLPCVRCPLDLALKAAS